MFRVSGSLRLRGVRFAVEARKRVAESLEAEVADLCGIFKNSHTWRIMGLSKQAYKYLNWGL